MRTRRSKGQASEPLVEPKNYTWCLLCTGERKAGFYTNGALRQHYAKKHNFEDVPRTVHDVLTSLLHEVEMRGGEEEEPRDASSEAAWPSPGSSHEVEMGNPSSHNNGSSSSIGGGGDGNGTTSSSERSSHDDRDLEDCSDGEREGTIRVGKDYQASIPLFIESSHEVERRTAVRWEQCENELTCPELRQKHVHVVHDLIEDPVPGSSHEVEMRIADDGEEDVQDGPQSSLELPPVDISPEPENKTVFEVLELKPTGASDQDNDKSTTENTEEQEEEEEMGINRGIPDPQYNALGEEMEVYRGVPEHQYNAWPGRCGRLKYLCYGCFVWFNDKFSIDRHFYLRHLCDEQRWPEDFPPLVRYN